MTPADQRRVASCLEREADALWRCHSLNGHWVLHDAADGAARADHDEMKHLAFMLREEADAREPTKPRRPVEPCPHCGGTGWVD